MSYRPDDACSEYGRLIVIAERLYDAVMAREAELVHALLDMGAATSLPREVREEALAVLALPPTSYRVPMQLLQFRQRLTELSRDSTVATGAGQIEFPWG